MKPLIIGIGIVVVMGVAIELTYDNSIVTEVIQKDVVVEVTPDWAEDTEAVEAAQAVIRRKEVEARIKVLDTEIEERQTEKETLEKELGTY